jgi:hypothetical protein
MAVLLLTSASGAPGVTTLGVGLALCWPQSVVLADCDPGAHQAVLAGYLAGTSAEGRGLLRVAEAHRDRRPLTEVVIDQSVPLTEDDTTSRLFLPGFARPSSAGLFGGVWPELSEAFVALDDHGFDVIVDAGRLSHSGLPTPLVERADLTALVLRSDLRSIVSARVHLLALREHPRLQASARSLGLILVGAGQPYSAREIGKSLGVPVIAEIADDVDTARHLSDGAPRARKFDSSRLARSLHTTAAQLSTRFERSAELVRG